MIYGCKVWTKKTGITFTCFTIVVNLTELPYGLWHSNGFQCATWNVDLSASSSLDNGYLEYCFPCIQLRVFLFSVEPITKLKMMAQKTRVVLWLLCYNTLTLAFAVHTLKWCKLYPWRYTHLCIIVLVNGFKSSDKYTGKWC